VDPDLGFADGGFGEGPFAAIGPEEPPPTEDARTRARPAGAVALVGGDTILAVDGGYVGAEDPVDELVAFAVGTVERHFFGDPRKGNGALTIQTMTRAGIVEVRDRVTRALRSLLDAGVIRDVRVTPTPFVRNGTAVNAFELTYRKTDRVERIPR
jgi:hypothetical protein